MNKKGPNPFIHLLNNEHIYIELDRFSSPTLVEDVANVVKIVVENDENGLFHLSGFERISRYEFMKIASETLNTNCKVIPIERTAIPRIATRPIDTSLESTKIPSLGYHPRSVKEGLKYVSSLLMRYRNVVERFEKKPSSTTGVLFDCIGVTLLVSQKYSKDPIVEELDILCGQSRHQNEIKEMITKKHNISSDKFYYLWERMLEKYIPNQDLLATLTSHCSKIKMSLFNNGCPDSFWWWVKRYHLDKTFNILKNSFEIKASKPSKNVFFYMADLLGVPSSKCLVVDDNYINIRAANKYGFPAFLYDEHYPFINEKLSYAINTIKRYNI
ncbi:hypothetical protein C5S31_10430 [ANME-1 cluster archaeon GoMg2]|nr:hypothetical protein [ANME-1 cluster archaeon GoMg2]